jgi:alpha-D-ribose 1-methylphosphonate 5-phosphate C-P lyase
MRMHDGTEVFPVVDQDGDDTGKVVTREFLERVHGIDVDAMRAEARYID